MAARAYSAGKRIFEILDAESAVKEATDAVALDNVTGHVSFENVSFGYTNLSPVLRNINIDAKPGQMVALLGPTGSGKTTIVNLLPRFYDVTQGRIAIDGRDIRTMTIASLRRCMAIVQQDVFLFTGTVRENICYGAPSATQELIERAASAARIHDFIMQFENGYDTVLDERGQNLSLGQRQLLSFARAILANPRILVLDEATARVDSTTEAVIQQALKQLLKGRTSFVIAHRLSTIRGADRIVALHDGHVIEMGAHDELLARDGLYSRRYRMTYEGESRDGNGYRADGIGKEQLPARELGRA